MKADVFYSTVSGRILLKVLQKAGLFRLASWLLHTRTSKHLIPGYIRKYGIDMTPFAGQEYGSFASFFKRKRYSVNYVSDPDVLISPCDGLLSVYSVTDEMEVHIKGSNYTMTDLVSEKKTAELFRGGLCLVFRLEASDYHHFCFLDDGELIETCYIPGRLHSVQPIALRTAPVFRLNRRWRSILETVHFGTVAQIEIGALLVGGVTFFKDNVWFERGEDMGCFELAGSTIILLLRSDVRERLVFREALRPGIEEKKEIRVWMGSAIGILK